MLLSDRMFAAFAWTRIHSGTLGEKADLSRRFIQEIEAGAKNPTVNTVVSLKKALQCSWNDLFAQTDD